MKQEYDKEKKISAELRKQYSLALLRFKFAERKVYPETCVLRVIVQEPTNSTKKKIEIDLGSEDSNEQEQSDNSDHSDELKEASNEAVN